MQIPLSKKNLSVRQTENIVKGWEKRQYSQSLDKNQIKKPLEKLTTKSDDLQFLSKALSEKFNTKVTIEGHLSGKIIF